jgi:hypothetical protein
MQKIVDKTLCGVMPDMSLFTDTMKELEHISKEIEKLVEHSEEESPRAIDASDITISFRHTSAIGWH